MDKIVQTPKTKNNKINIFTLKGEHNMFTILLFTVLFIFMSILAGWLKARNKPTLEELMTEDVEVQAEVKEEKPVKKTSKKTTKKASTKKTAKKNTKKTSKK